MSNRDRRALYQLARHYGLLPAYDDVTGQRRIASPEALSAVLGALGVKLQSPSEARSLLRQAKRDQWEPYLSRRLQLPGDLPTGYHRLTLETAKGSYESLVLSAPSTISSRNGSRKAWAGLLRFDHVMGLHRLYWIPAGSPATEGVYVAYPAEELYAILSIESQRYGAGIVGENLGTVPPVVNSSMRRHGVREMFVVQYELKPDPEKPLRPVPSRSIASMNTQRHAPISRFLARAGHRGSNGFGPN